MRLTVLILAGALIVGGTLAVRFLKQRKRKQMSDQDDINRAVETIKAKDSVIHGAVLALAALTAKFKKAVADLAASDVDTSGLNAAIADSEASFGELAEAVAANTPAEDEVAGIGDDSSTVDPASVDTTEVTPADGGGTGGQGGVDQG